MSRRNGIIVSANPKGTFMEGIVGAGLTVYPGQVVQPDLAVALVGGRHTYTHYNADADGGRPKGPYYIVLENYLMGKLMTESYGAGERLFLYCPQQGDELNLLFGDVAGTGATSDIAIGDMLIPNDTDGKWLVSTGSPETEPAQALEAFSDLTADQLVWCAWTGY